MMIITVVSMLVFECQNEEFADRYREWHKKSQETLEDAIIAILEQELKEKEEDLKKFNKEHSSELEEFSKFMSEN